MTDDAVVAVESRSPDISHFLIRAICLATTVISIMVLIGWHYSIPVFKSLIPGANTMKVNTAVGFFFAGTALLFFLQQTGSSQPKPSSGALSRFCAGVPLVIGILTLSEYFFDVNLGIDEMLMSGEPDPRTPSPGRMSRMTASGLMLLGVGLLTGFGQIRFKHLIIKLAAITVLFIASFGLLSYLYQPNALYKLPVFSSMALPTAFLLALLSISLLLAHSALKSAAWRYSAAACIVAAGYGLRLVLSIWVGVELPPFITLYPVILITAIFAGLGPGIFATVLSSFIAWTFVYDPVGELTIATTVNIIAVSSFFVFGIILSALIELHGAYRSKADEYDRLMALQETNQRFKNLIAASPCMLFCIHTDKGSLKPLWISENVKTILDFSVAEALDPEWWINHVHPDDRERASAAWAGFFNVGKLSQEYRFLHRSGKPIWIREELRLEKDRHGKPSEIIGTWLDISQSKRVEIVQSLRNAVLDQVVSNQKLTSILHDIVRRLEQMDPEMIVSILLLDRFTGKLFTGAAPSLPDYYNTKIDGLEPAIGRGSCGTSAYLGEPVIVDEIDNHPYWQPYLKLAQQAGVHACWSMPIKDDNNQVIGTFAIYYRTKRAPVAAELEFIREFTRITALAIQKVNTADALRQSAAVFENIRDGVFITDLAHNIVAINRSYSEITGYNEDEVLGKHPNILKSDGQDIGCQNELWKNILKSGYWKGEIWDRRKNGETYPQWLTISTVFDELGAPKNYVGVITDISQIKQSELALQESESLFRQVTESLPQLIWTCLPDGACDYLSPQWCRYTGLPEDDQLGNGWLEQVHPDDRERVITAWMATAPQGLEYDIEYRIRRHDGVYRWFYGVAVPLRDESGAIVKWYGSSTDISERKQIEAALREREHSLDAIIDNSPSALSLKYPDGRYALANPNLQRIHHLSEAEIIGKTDFDLFPEATARSLQANDRRILETMARQSMEEIVLVDGVPRVYMSHMFPLLNDAGQVEYICRISLDITESKRAEDELRKSESRYRQVTESLPQLVWTCQADGTCDYLSPQWCQYTGIPEAPQLGVGWLEQLHPEDRDRAISEWVATTQQGKHFNIEYRIRRHDGVYRWFYVVAVPLRDESGAIVKWFGSNTDIDEQKQARDAVIESEERLRLLVEYAPAAIAMFDTEMCYLAASQQWLKDYQLPEDILGRCHYDLFPELPERWKQAHQRGLAGETYTGVDDVFERDGLPPLWLHWKLYPWYKVNGAIGGIIVFVQDVTEHKNYEAQLQRYQDHLEQLVEERTHELEEARQEALRLSQVKTVFLANMSHEIRSPMNAMLGFLYLLEQKPLDAEVHDLVRKVRNGGKSLLAIINDILDFSKIEAGQLEIQHVPFRLSDVIDQIAALMSAYSVEKNLELIIDVYPTLADYLIGDAVKLQQVLVNLASNAIKFTEQGEVKLMIKVVEPVAEKSLKIRFSVKDTGIGIDPAKQQDIFTPFAQADGSISRRFGGTGLGLAISRQLVELMGGSLKVDSEIGKGSTFWFELVLEQDLSRNPELYELKHLNVLIVDDCEATSAALANAARFLGWQAETAISGQDACVRILTRLTTDKPYDVILADWQMPGMDGLTLANEIKKMYQTEANTAVRSPLVIMVSAFAREQLLTQPGIGNADLVLTKPLTPSTFYDAVLALLSKRINKPDSATAMLRDVKTAQLAGINVLVVDDSEVNCELAATILSLHGAQVMTFNNGYKVIEWLKTHHNETDVILMDVQMPEIDGYETTRLIRQMPPLAHIPIAALTAGAFSEDQDNARTAGMDDFIPKPFDVYHLISVIQRLTRHQPERVLISETANPTGHSADSQPDSQELPEPVLVDETEGVSRFGDRSVYFTYLNKFIAANMNAGKDILALIQAGDAAAAAALAHKLKGTAGNLALKRIAQCAADIETILKTNDNPEQLCQRLKQDIEATGNEIRRLSAAN